MYHVYVLLRLKDGKYYTGRTKDPIKRVRLHNLGKVKSTRNRGPFKLVYFEACLSSKDAARREIYLKSSWGKRYIKNRLKNYMKKGPSEIV